MITETAPVVARAINRVERTREPQEAGALAQGLAGLIPARLRDQLVPEVAERARIAREARSAGVPIPRSGSEDDIPVSDVVLRQQAEGRERALQACLPSTRMAAEVGLASLEPDQHPRGVAEWLDDPELLTLILAGRTGSGKTQAAYAAAAEAARNGAMMRNRRGQVVRKQLLVRAWTLNGYLQALRPNGSKEPVWEIRDRAYNAELLILDDIGVAMDEEATRFFQETIHELLSYRLNQGYRTIFTTNLRSRDAYNDRGEKVQVGLASRVGDTLWSRLNERSTVLTFTGPDRRMVTELDW
ncbi:ATP-binding protein [Micromonospora sp. STR1s_5]|nr:ATP-binding protein [Micromonospora sp. STR1s_5]